MASLRLSDIDVTFRIFDAGERSFTRRMLSTGLRRKLNIAALNGVSIDLEPGSRVAVLGANSSGKTTLLRVMAGLLPPTAGQVVIDGTPGAVFSMGFGVDPEASLGDLAFAQGLLMGCSASVSKERVREAMEFAGLSDLAETRAQIAPPGILSRLGIATVLCMGADIILLDEVLEQIDPVFHDRFETAISRRLAQGGILVLTERSRDLLSRYCTEVLLLNEGRIAARTPLADALHNLGAAQTF